jgi:hypothetical protein
VLSSVAKGEMTLQPSPQEQIDRIEAEHGHPLPEVFKQSVHRMLSGEERRESDNARKERAMFMLNCLGIKE